MTDDEYKWRVAIGAEDSYNPNRNFTSGLEEFYRTKKEHQAEDKRQRFSVRKAYMKKRRAYKL